MRPGERETRGSSNFSPEFASSGQEEEGEWKKVERKKSYNSKKRVSKDPFYSPYWTSYYVTNFPEDCDLHDLRKACEKLGEVSDVFIAKKRNKERARFGFVKFNQVENKVGLEMKLNSIKMGHLKLHANLEKIDRKGKLVHLKPIPEKDKIAAANHGSETIDKGGSWTLRGNKSFLGVLTGSSQPEKQEKVVDIGEWEPETNAKWKYKSLLGRVLNMQALDNLEEICKVKDFMNCNIKYIGGLNVLLCFDNPTNACNALKCESTWKMWFCNMDLWRGQSFLFERFVWVDITGVPPNVWDKTLFDKIANEVGEVYVKSSVDANRKVLTSDRLAILVNHCHFISEEVTLVSKGKIFKCDVREAGVPWEWWSSTLEEKNKHVFSGDDNRVVENSGEDRGVKENSGEDMETSEDGCGQHQPDSTDEVGVTEGEGPKDPLYCDEKSKEDIGGNKVGEQDVDQVCGVPQVSYLTHEKEHASPAVTIPRGEQDVDVSYKSRIEPNGILNGDMARDTSVQTELSSLRGSMNGSQVRLVNEPKSHGESFDLNERPVMDDKVGEELIQSLAMDPRGENGSKLERTSFITVRKKKKKTKLRKEPSPASSWRKEDLASEVISTVDLGALIGVDLSGYEDMVREDIIGEGANDY